MQSVTSNAIANIQTKTSVTITSGITVSKVNKIVTLSMQGLFNIDSNNILFTLPEGYRPDSSIFIYCQYRNQIQTPNLGYYICVLNILPDGTARGWFQTENSETEIIEDGYLYGVATYII